MFTKLVSLLPTPTFAYSLFHKSEPEEEGENAYFKKAILDVSNESENSIRSLIGILEKCITTISKRYRENILEQIAVLTQNDASLLKADEFVKLQLENDRLKAHLQDYKLLAENSGKMAYNQAVSALHCGFSDPGVIVCQVYCAFEKLYTNEYKLNDEYERNLSWMTETVNGKLTGNDDKTGVDMKQDNKCPRSRSKVSVN